jgi:hypothetical protein
LFHGDSPNLAQQAFRMFLVGILTFQAWG